MDISMKIWQKMEICKEVCEKIILKYMASLTINDKVLHYSEEKAEALNNQFYYFECY